MSRKTAIITIPTADGNRDSGKLFLLTEMYAMPAEKWAQRAFFALTNSGFDVPPDLAQSGMAGVALIGLQSLSKVRYEDAEPLLEEMMSCVKIIRNPNNLDLASPLSFETDIEEVSTLMLLRMEVFKLHVNFSMDALQSFLKAVLMWTARNSSTTQISQDQSAP